METSMIKKNKDLRIIYIIDFYFRSKFCSDTKEHNPVFDSNYAVYCV